MEFFRTHLAILACATAAAICHQGQAATLNETRIAFTRAVNIGTDKEQALRINIRRMERIGAPAVILTHATNLSNIAMRDWAEFLWNEGFDVWVPNLRAHGNGDEMTTVTPYYPGDYGFDQMVTEDLPAILTYVLSHTNTPVHVIGYSLGGMVWEQFLSGVYSDGTTVRRNIGYARDLAKRVQSFVELGVPPDLKGVSPEVRRIMAPVTTIFNLGSFFLPLTLNVTPETSGIPLLSPLRSSLIRLVAPALPYLFPDGIVNFANIDPEDDELVGLAINSISSPHCDYMRDLVHWFDAPYASRNGNADYAHSKTVFVPTLRVAASHDALAPLADIKASTNDFIPEARVQLVVAEGFSHVDLAFRKAVATVGRDIVKFLRQ